MAFKSFIQSDAITRYINQDMLHETDAQKRLRAETGKLPNGQMQISPDQGAFLSLLVKLMGVKKSLEIGTFTGYSALSVAMALPAGGKLVCCDVSEEWTNVGRRYWKEAGVADRIDLRLGPAMQTLAAMIEHGDSHTFDFCFIDADKENYDTYYELALKLIRHGGLIALDNMLDSRGGDKSTFDPVDGPRHPLNLKIHNDARVESMFAMVGGGLLLARKV